MSVALNCDMTTTKNYGCLCQYKEYIQLETSTAS
jgi:hypothetical protein